MAYDEKLWIRRVLHYLRSVFGGVLVWGWILLNIQPIFFICVEIESIESLQQSKIRKFATFSLWCTLRSTACYAPFVNPWFWQPLLQGRGREPDLYNFEFYDDTVKVLFREKKCIKSVQKVGPPIRDCLWANWNFIMSFRDPPRFQWFYLRRGSACVHPSFPQYIISRILLTYGKVFLRHTHTHTHGHSFDCARRT